MRDPPSDFPRHISKEVALKGHDLVEIGSQICDAIFKNNKLTSYTTHQATVYILIHDICCIQLKQYLLKTICLLRVTRSDKYSKNRIIYTVACERSSVQLFVLTHTGQVGICIIKFSNFAISAFRNLWLQLQVEVAVSEGYRV